MSDDDFYTEGPFVPKKKKTTLKLTDTAAVSVDDAASSLTPTAPGESTGLGGMANATAPKPQTSHGFGHDTINRLGTLRLSGVPGAHRIGKR